MSFIDNFRKAMANSVLLSLPNRTNKNTPPSPTVRELNANRYNPSIPENWITEDYDIVTKNDDGTYSMKESDHARIYRDSNGNYVGLDTPMQSYSFSPNEDGLSKITEILDSLQSDGKTEIWFNGRKINPSNPSNQKIFRA